MPYQFSKMSILFVLLFVCKSNLSAQQIIVPVSDNAAPLFKIQVGAYRNIALAYPEKLQDLGKLYTEDAGNGIKRLLIGYYKQNADAEKVLLQIKERGYKEAFMAVQKGEPLPESARLLPKNDKKISTEPQTFNAPETDTETNKEAKNNIQQTPTTEILAPNEAYTIVLDGKDAFIEEKLDTLLGMGKVFVPQGTDKYKLAVGELTSYEIAEQLRITLQNQGFFEINIAIFNMHNNRIVRMASNPTFSTPNKETKTEKETTTSIIPKATIPPTSATPQNKEADKIKEKETPKNAAATATVQPIPEAIFKPRDKKTPPISLPNDEEEVVQSVLSLPESHLSENPSLMVAPELPLFSEFKQYFTPIDTNQLVIEAYDPTLESIDGDTMQWDDRIAKTNRFLKGKPIADKFLVLLDSMPKNADGKWSYHALYRFALDQAHDAYIVRAGRNVYHNDNLIYLHVYSKLLGDFTEARKISNVWGGNGINSYMQSWIEDMNYDGKKDLLSYITEEVTADGKLSFSERFVAYTWSNDGRFLEAQIANEAALKKRLGIR